jgi:hypothetical protein
MENKKKIKEIPYTKNHEFWKLQVMLCRKLKMLNLENAWKVEH